MKQPLIILLSLLFYSQIWAITIDHTTATALNQVNLYGDSTFVEHTPFTYKEGQIFKIIKESYFQHPDADQKQKFKWYQVETPDMQIGWIFGDGLAVFVEPQDLDPILRPYHQKKLQLGNGFESAVSWVAAIQGRDNFHEQDYMNPLYSEFYIVVTNNRGRSVMMKCAGESARGETQIQNVINKDITGDDHPEFIVVTGTNNIDSELQERDITIYSMKAGTLVAIFEENIALSYETGIPSPSLFKNIEIENKSIRISYVDYINCNNYKLEYSTDPKFPKKERCLEYVTTTYSWDKKTKTFKNVYGHTRIAPSGGIWNSTSILKDHPQNGQSVGTISKGDLLKIIKHYEEYVVEGGKKKIKNWFLIETANGKRGYILANEVGFIDIEHSEILNKYYLSPPLSKSLWKGNVSKFIHFY